MVLVDNLAQLGLILQLTYSESAVNHSCVITTPFLLVNQSLLHRLPPVLRSLHTSSELPVHCHLSWSVPDIHTIDVSRRLLLCTGI